MGDCYSVCLLAKLKDEKAACDALRALIDRKGNDGRANFSLGQYAEQGITPDNFDGLMQIFFAEWKGQRVEIVKHDDGFTTYENGFNASYGWGLVLEDMFDVLAPFLAEGSAFYVDADETYLDYEMLDGEAVSAA